MPVPIALVPLTATVPVPAGTVTVTDVAECAVTVAATPPKLIDASARANPVTVMLVPASALVELSP